MINYDMEDGFSVTTFEPSQNGQNSSFIHSHPVPSKSSLLVISTVSILSIKEVHFKHAGNYTCAPSNARPASIMVHVLRGKFFIFLS